MSSHGQSSTIRDWVPVLQRKLKNISQNWIAIEFLLAQDDCAIELVSQIWSYIVSRL